jgi:hypothetical protein
MKDAARPAQIEVPSEPQTPASILPARENQRWFTAFALAISAVALGHALQVSRGTLHPRAVFWLSAALIACGLGIAAPPVLQPLIRGIERRADKTVLCILGGGLALHFSQLFRAPAGDYLWPAHLDAALPFLAGLVVAAALVVALWARPSLWRWWFAALLLTHFLLGVWIIESLPRPFIDVYIFQRDSSKALLHGVNPYALTFPDIYEGKLPYYGKGIAAHGRLMFGFPYPPLSLYLALPGHVFGGDYRYSQLVAITLAALLMACARPGRLSALAASLYLFTPTGFFVLRRGWTEPFVVLLLAAVVFCACRKPKALPVAFGLLLAVKQYLVFALPLAFLLVSGPFRWHDLWRLWRRAGLVALAISLPLMVWNPRAFLWDVAALQLYQPFRLDALSYLAWIARGEGPRLPTGLAFIAATAALALALWRAARTPAGFAAAAALVYFAFFAFNKQAFCNYYFFVIGALCCTIAATQPWEDMARREKPE